MTATAYRYSAYGINIQSELELPELTPSEFGAPDLRLVFEELPNCTLPGPSANYKLEGEPKRFVWSDVGRFELRDNALLAMDPASGVTDRYLSFAVLGPIIAYVLHARGNLVLHASAIGAGPSCAAFVAPKGVGKSTTAAACVAAGYVPVNDDVMSITLTSEAAYCTPGFPQLKLKHDAAAALPIPRSVVMPPARENFSKSQHRIEGPFSLAPRRVERIYALKRGEHASVRVLTQLEELQVLLANAYIPLFARRRAFVSATDKARIMRQCAQLRRSCQVKEFEVPQDLQQLSLAVHCLEQDWRASQG